MPGKAGGSAVKRAAAFALALLLLCLAPLSCLADLDADTVSEADAYFQRMFSRAGAVGGAVLVSQQGRRVYSFYWGGGDKRATRPVDDGTVYKVASVSKLISAIGVVQLAESGALDLDAPITWGDEDTPIRNPRFPDAPITLRQVMSHTSSLLTDAPYVAAPAWEKTATLEQRYFSKYAPGSHYEYSNLNGGMLCSAVERASGMSFNSYMAEHIFSPLGVNAAYAATLLPDPSALSGTYRTSGLLYMSAEKYLSVDTAQYDDTCAPDRHYHASAGSLYISLSGLEKMGQVLCAGEADGVRILSPQAARQMLQDQSLLPGSTVTASSPYGLCALRFTGDDGETWYGHQGRWEGLLTDLFVKPDSGAVVVFVMNGVGRSGTGKEIDAKAERTLHYVLPWLSSLSILDDGMGFVVEDGE